MRCLFCDSETTITATRDADDGEKIVRRRECRNGHRFRTTEAPGELLVRKGAGHLEPFDKGKVAQGVRAALYKWMSEKDAWAKGWEAADKVKTTLLERIDDRKSIEVYPSEIGQLVLEQLKEINWFGWLSYQGVFMKQRKGVTKERQRAVQREIEALLDEILTVPRPLKQ